MLCVFAAFSCMIVLGRMELSLVWFRVKVTIPLVFVWSKAGIAHPSSENIYKPLRLCDFANFALMYEGLNKRMVRMKF